MIATAGQFVEIIANTNFHEFEIGQIVIVVDWDVFEPEGQGVECAPTDGGEHWFVRHTDYRIVEYPDTLKRLREQLAQEQRDHAATKAELERMRDALEFYANAEHYQDARCSLDPREFEFDHPSSIEQDNGRIARNALKGGTDQC